MMEQEVTGRLPDGTGLVGLRPEPASSLGQSATIPSADQIQDHLLRFPADADFVRQMPEGHKVEPEEIWIGRLGAWLRTDGSYASFDRARGGIHYAGKDRDELARVVAYWKTSFHAQAIEARRAATGTGAVHESAVPQGCAHPLPESSQ